MVDKVRARNQAHKSLAVQYDRDTIAIKQGDQRIQALPDLHRIEVAGHGR